MGKKGREECTSDSPEESHRARSSERSRDRKNKRENERERSPVKSSGDKVTLRRNPVDNQEHLSCRMISSPTPLPLSKSPDTFCSECLAATFPYLMILIFTSPKPRYPVSTLLKASSFYPPHLAMSDPNSPSSPTPNPLTASFRDDADDICGTCGIFFHFVSQRRHTISHSLYLLFYCFPF